MISLIVISLAWGVPLVLSNQPEMANLEVNPPPSNSKEGFYLRGAVSADSTVCPPIGRRMLEKGGSAVDAAIAILFCQGVAEPHRSGLGGGMYMLIYQRDERHAVAIDARETAPRAAHRDMFERNINSSSRGGLSIAVPGELFGLWEAHKHFGILPWSELVEPSVILCEEGVVINQHLAECIQHFEDLITADPVLREIFTNNTTGEILKTGDTIKNPRLGKTLRIIAQNGASALYNGSLTTALLQEIERAGGILQPSDLNSYQTRWSKPVSSHIMSEGNILRMFTTQPPSGGVVLTHILNILKGYIMGPQDDETISNQVITLHRIIEAFKYSYAKRSLLGDPMYVNITQVVHELLSKKYAEAERQKIDDYKTVEDISFYGSTFFQPEDFGTTHVCVVASNGDAVSATSSINLNFGSGLMSNSTGILLNNEMDDFSIPNTKNRWGTFSSTANFISPGKRPLSSMSPVIVTNETGDVRLVIGGAGGVRIITSVALVMIRNLWLGDSIKEAIDARRIHHQLVPNILEYEYGMLNQKVAALKSRHHNVKQVIEWPSHITAIERKSNGILVANSDFRKGGTVDGID